MDTFKEYMVTRRQDGKDRFQIFGLTFLCCFALMLAITFFQVIAPFVGFVIFGLMAAFYGVYIFAAYKEIEYEYIFTNGDMDVDKIMGQRKRRRLITVDITGIMQFGKVTEQKRAEIFSSDCTVVDATDNMQSDEDYYLQCKHKTLGLCYVVFTPSEQFVEELKPYFPRELKNKQL